MFARKLSKRDLDLHSSHKGFTKERSGSSLSKYSRENGWAALQSFNQVLHTIRKEYDSKEKRRKIDCIKASLEEQVKEQHQARLMLLLEKQQQQKEMKELTNKERDEEFKFIISKRIKQNKEKQIIGIDVF